jgi:peptidylprolyl isomerase
VGTLAGILIETEGAAMRQAKNGDKVKIHYTGMLEDGTVFDTSRNREALKVTLGSGTVIRGLEDALMGMSVGETKELEIAPADAFGLRKEELVIQVEKGRFPTNIDPQEGMTLKLTGNEEEEVPAVITEVSEDSVIIDANHPLAGKDLTFYIELVDIV